MAERVGRAKGAAKGDGKVITLPTRKARGAAGAKRSSKPVNRLKPQAGEAKAPLTQEQIDAQARKGQVERIAALTNQHRQMDNKIEGVKLSLNELNGEKKLIRTAIQNAGVRLEVFDERYEKLKLKTKRTDLQAIERERDLCNEAMGLSAGQQSVIDFDKLPEAAKPAVHWRYIGYQAGITGESCDPAGAGCPPEATQEFNTGWGEGQTVIAAGMKTLAADKTKAKDKAAPANDSPAEAPAAAPGAKAQPDWDDFDFDPGNWTENQRQTFTAWYNALGPEDDVDILHPGVEVAFDRNNDSVDPFTGEAVVIA